MLICRLAVLCTHAVWYIMPLFILLQERALGAVWSSLLLFSLLSCISAQPCSQTGKQMSESRVCVFMYLLSLLAVMPASFLTFTAVYRNTLVLSPSVCSLFRNTHFRCDYDIVLGDGNTVSISTPDLSNDSPFLNKFVALQRGSDMPLMPLFIDFDLTGVSTGITAIELSFLNNPENQISLPDIELSRVTYGSSFFTDTISSFPSRILNNQDLTQTDNQVRTVFIRPLLGQASLNIRIGFQFNQSHDFNTLLLSEVRFCTNLQPQYTPDFMFLSPLTNIVEPSADDLSSGSVELVCTVSGQGSYTWTWEKDNSEILSSAVSLIVVGDGSRTSKLTIRNLSFSSAAEYKCTGGAVDLLNAVTTGFVVHEIQFPGKHF